MAGRYLPDSSILVAFFNEEAAVMRRMADADEVYLASAVVGELYYGAFRSARVDENLARLDTFVAATPVLVCDGETAREYGFIRDQLRRKGRPIPDNDIWIAAAARQHDLVLVTRDSHFAEIDGLACEAW